MMPTSNTDTELWSLTKEGDKDSFAAIYHQYFKNLYEYGSRLIDDRDLVKDCIHDLFVKLWANKGNLGDVQNVKTYLIVSLRHLIYNRMAAGKKNRLKEIDENYHFEMDWSVETKLIEKENLSEQSKKLLSAMDALSARQKEIIYLKYFEDLSYDEIADVLGITTKAAYKLLYRALDALKDIFNVPKMVLLSMLSFCKADLLS